MPKTSTPNLAKKTAGLLSELNALEKEFANLRKTALKLMDKHQISKIKKRIVKK